MATRKPSTSTRRKTPPAATIELVVRRGALKRFHKLKEKTTDLPVHVSWDRRQGERRTASRAPDTDKRVTDRRKKPPMTWDVADFVVLEKPRR